MNSRHESIKFTLETSLTSVNFLDVTVINSGTTKLSTTLYCKPTDSHNYLLYSSEHPRHLLKGIPYSQFLRVRRICSNITDYRKNALMLATHFIRRGYPKYLIERAYHRAELLDRDTLIEKNSPTKIAQTTPKTKQNDDPTFYLVTTYNPRNPPIREIVEKNWHLLERSKTRGLTDAKLIFGQRRNKNLSDQLVRASTKTATHSQTHITTHPCNRDKNCRYCPTLNKTGEIVSTTTGRNFQSMKSVNCQSSNLIYAITCNYCHIQYVGQTKNRLLTRFQGLY